MIYFCAGALFDKSNTDDNKYSKFLNNFYQSDNRSAGSTSSSLSNISPARSGSDKSRPPKPPRNRRGRRRFWEEELNVFQDFSNQSNANILSSSSADEFQTNDNNDKVSLQERLI